MGISPFYPVQHHAKLYFDDGNVVFSAVSSATGDRRYFRVHKSIICRQSPVLADMFALPPLREDGCDEGRSMMDRKGEDRLKEVYDGVVHVETPDSAEELESFLRVLYDPL